MAEPTTKAKWPDGFTPDPALAHYLNVSFAQRKFSEQVREKALLWAASLDEELRELWSDQFADWCADRAKNAEWQHLQEDGTWLPTFRMPNFKRSWKAFYDEPIDYGDEESDEPGGE